jgi:hypothetical protein
MSSAAMCEARALYMPKKHIKVNDRVNLFKNDLIFSDNLGG